jgi:CHASE3 domain sensor protein
MLIDPNRLVSWQEFTQIPHVKRLSINEQVAQYNQYTAQFNILRTQMLNRGSGPFGYLLQENLAYLTQENGAKLIIKK